MISRIKKVKPLDIITLPNNTDFITKDGDGWTANEWMVVKIHRNLIEAVALDEEGKIAIGRTRCFDIGTLTQLRLEL